MARDEPKGLRSRNPTPDLGRGREEKKKGLKGVETMS